jgi:hypothetical protein
VTPRDAFVQACAELGQTNMVEYLLRDFEDRLQGETLTPETVARHRIYPVGSTLGLLLDFFGVDWKPRAARDGESFSFVGLLDEHLGGSQAQKTESLAWAKQRYDYERIVAATQREAERYLASYDAATEEFEATPGYRIELRVSSNGVSRGRSSRSRRWVVENGTRVFSSNYVTYTLRRASDEFFFQVHDRALLDTADRESGTKTVTFFTDDAPEFELDGGAATPLSDGTYDFERLAISGEGFELRYGAPGTLTVDDRRVAIDLAR